MQRITAIAIIKITRLESKPLLPVVPSFEVIVDGAIDSVSTISSETVSSTTSDVSSVGLDVDWAFEDVLLLVSAFLLLVSAASFLSAS